MKFITFIVLFLFVTVSSCGGCLPELGLNKSARKFDSKIWKEAIREDGIREEMSDDLIKNVLKLGANKNSIIEKLGKSDNDIFNFFEKNQQAYHISTGLDPCFLILTFDENNKLSFTEIKCI